MQMDTSNTAFFTAALRDKLQERLYTMAMNLIDANDPEIAIKAAALLERMYQADIKPVSGAKGKPTTSEPLSKDARKAAIQERLNALKTPSKN